MTAQGTTRSRAPASCERCGSILVIFEEHPDGGVIYCACRCTTKPRAMNEPEPPRIATSAVASSAPPQCSRCGKPLQVFDDWGGGEVIYLGCACAHAPAAPPKAAVALPAREPRYCRNCHTALVVVGSRPDGSPIEAECPCQRRPRPEPISRPAIRGWPQEPEPLSGGRNTLLITAGSVVLVAALAGFWARSTGGTSAPEPPPRATTPEESEPAPATAAPASQLPGGVEIRNDDRGRVTRVSGSDPSSVLRAFCRHPQFKSALVPGSLQATTPPDPDLLVGSAILMDGAGTPRQVILKRDPTSKRWSIGDGTTTIALGDSSAPPASPAVPPR